MATPLPPTASEVAESVTGTTLPPIRDPSTDPPRLPESVSVEDLDQGEEVQSCTGLTNVPPVIPRAVPGPVALPEQVGRFRILGMIARGGMGLVLRAFDPVLGRELALKVLRLRDADAEQQRRFVEEAQISARLQHPGIAPLHELAHDEAGRPFLVMKLIEGRTFAQLLAERASPAADLPRCLHVFEQICQTLAYAHTKGVLHRDLKPHNIMVGAFGEVQVMDWGLAKEVVGLRSGEVVKETPVDEMPAVLRHPTASPPQLHHTQEGTILGTLSYMAPEQARGEISLLTARADVYGLGAILCEILTGLPPFRGKNWMMLLRRVQQGDLNEAWQRLEECKVDRELVDLARACLAPAATERPADATEVAQRVTVYLAGVQEKLRHTEIARVQEHAKAEHEHRARRLITALATAVVLLVTVGAGGGWWLSAQRAERRAAADVTIRQALGEARVFQAEGKFTAGIVALKQMEPLLRDADPTLASAVGQLRGDLEQKEKDQRLSAALDQVQLSKTNVKGDKFDQGAATAGYVAAFADYGLPVETGSPDAVVQMIRQSSRPEVLCAALDDWAYLKKRAEEPPETWQRLWDITTAADPHPWRNRLRAALRQQPADRKALLELATQADIDQPMLTLHLLENGLMHVGERGLLIGVWRKAYAQRPNDFWVNVHLAFSLELLKPPQLEETLRFHTAALAMRPTSPGAHVNVGHVLAELQRYTEAEAAFRRAVELAPDYAMAHHNVGLMRFKQGDPAGALPHYDRALQLQPDMARAHTNKGVALGHLGRRAEAIKCQQRALELKPREAQPLLDLGQAMEIGGHYAEALPYYQKALDLEPNNADALLLLGNAYLVVEEPAKALPLLLNAERLSPEYPIILYTLGQAFEALQRYEEALPRFTKAVARRPAFALAHFKRGVVLMNLGRLTEAVAALETGDTLGRKQQPNWNHPTARVAADCRRFLELEKRLPAVRKGEDHPKDAQECLDFARLSWMCRREFAAGVHFYQEALTMRPPLAPNRALAFRAKAASAAARAGCGLGNDAAAQFEAERKGLRRQALAWMRLDLQYVADTLHGNNATNRGKAREFLTDWRNAPDLACIRESEQLRKLPANEQEEWRKFWQEVDELLRNSSGNEKPYSS